MSDTANALALTLSLVLMLVGLLGTVLPVLPGTILIFAGALLYAFLEGFQIVGWPTLALLGVLTGLATTAELWAASVGAKVGGASGWSVLAGLAGGLVGLLFFSLPGAIAGAVMGVLISEMVRVGDWQKALKAGGGWAVGWLISAVVQVAVGLAMVAIFIWQVWQGP
ncbi:MAG: DUF456 domain-containing protein [Anaerolineae bacterium]